MQEAVGRDQLNAAVFRPAAQQCLQQARCCALTDGYAAGDADDIGNFARRCRGIAPVPPAAAGWS